MNSATKEGAGCNVIETIGTSNYHPGTNVQFLYIVGAKLWWIIFVFFWCYFFTQPLYKDYIIRWVPCLGDYAGFSNQNFARLYPFLSHMQWLSWVEFSKPLKGPAEEMQGYSSLLTYNYMCPVKERNRTWGSKTSEYSQWVLDCIGLQWEESECFSSIWNSMSPLCIEFPSEGKCVNGHIFNVLRNPL